MSSQILLKYFSPLLLLLFVTRAFSQKRYELSVKEAVELAFKNVTDVKNAELDVKIQNAQNQEITGQALPQLSGTGSINRYLKLPQVLFPASEEGIYKVLKE